MIQHTQMIHVYSGIPVLTFTLTWHVPLHSLKW